MNILVVEDDDDVRVTTRLELKRQGFDVVTAADGLEALDVLAAQAAEPVDADAVSAARPGARKETLDAYVKRLEKLEEIANSHKGVERTYAIQAGREVRVMVEPEVVDEAESVVLAHDIAQQIENEGHATVFEALETLVMAGGAVETELSGGFSANAHPLNLRGLGPGRSLLLIDGRRAADYPFPYGGRSNFQNFGNIPSGAVERRNSTIRFWPCWRMSTPTWLLGRSTTTRPAPSRPRRKSMSRSDSGAVLRLSAKCSGSAEVRTPAAAAVAGVPEDTCTGSSVTTSALPSISAR